MNITLSTINCKQPHSPVRIPVEIKLSCQCVSNKANKAEYTQIHVGTVKMQHPCPILLSSRQAITLKQFASLPSPT